MPEAGEVDLDRVREAIDEEVEREGGALLRAIALTTALLAALAAIASLLAGSTVNEALVLKSEATRLQAQASDQWAYYQAKGIKSAITTSTAEAYRAAGRPVPDSLTRAVARYARDQAVISDQAHALEKERDQREADASALLAHHHHFAYSVALLQVAIALGAVAALTRRRSVWIFSSVLGGIGLVLLAYAQFNG